MHESKRSRRARRRLWRDRLWVRPAWFWMGAAATAGPAIAGNLSSPGEPPEPVARFR